MTDFWRYARIRLVMVSEARRQAIKRFYRMARLTVEKTQIEVESLARLDAGKFWKIENGFVFPDEKERERLARVLKVNESDLPTETSSQKGAAA